MALELPKSTVHLRLKEGKIRPHTNAIKPTLSEQNKRFRLEFCLSMVDSGNLNTSPSFINMHDRVHIYEKWFYISNPSRKYYLHPEEEEPYRTCKSKRFITKIMFLAAVARPRTDSAFGMSFDGKIGIWPLVYKEVAKRNSRNQSAGTVVIKSILSVTKEVTRSFMIDKVLPIIKEKWPNFSSKIIDVNDVDFIEAAEGDGFDIKLYCQPPNSPDMNVLDLGFFRAIDSLQHQEDATNIDEFILAVEKAFEIFPKEELNNVFLTLQSCMVEVMKNAGGNNYKIPHMKKHVLLRRGELPDVIEFDMEILDQAKVALSEYCPPARIEEEDSSEMDF